MNAVVEEHLKFQLNSNQQYGYKNSFGLQMPDYIFLSKTNVYLEFGRTVLTIENSLVTYAVTRHKLLKFKRTSTLHCQLQSANQLKL